MESNTLEMLKHSTLLHSAKLSSAPGLQLRFLGLQRGPTERGLEFYEGCGSLGEGPLGVGEMRKGGRSMPDVLVCPVNKRVEDTIPAAAVRGPAHRVRI